MTNQANNLDRDLRELFRLGAEFIDPEPSRNKQALAKAKRRILRNVVIAAAALALIGLGTVEISRAVSTDTAVRRSPADTGSPTGPPVSPADVVADIEVGGNPPFVAAGGGYLWVLDGSSRAILRVDPNSHAVTRIPFEGLLIGHPAVGFGSLWVANPDASPSGGASPQTRSGDAPSAPKEPSQPPRPSPWLQRIDLGTGAATGIALPEGADPYQVAVGEDALWVGDTGGRVYRVDPDTNAIVATVDVRGDLSPLASFDGRIWALVDDGSEASLQAIDPATNKVDQSIGLGFSTSGVPPTGLVGGEGSLWLTACLPSLPDCTWNVLRIDPGSGAVTAQVDVGELRNGIVDGGDGTTRAAVVADNAGRVWVLANTGSFASPQQQDARGQLLAIDPASNQVVSTIDIGPGYPYDLDSTETSPGSWTCSVDGSWPSIPESCGAHAEAPAGPGDRPARDGHRVGLYLYPSKESARGILSRTRITSTRLSNARSGRRAGISPPLGNQRTTEIQQDIFSTTARGPSGPSLVPGSRGPCHNQSRHITLIGTAFQQGSGNGSADQGENTVAAGSRPPPIPRRSRIKFL